MRKILLFREYFLSFRNFYTSPDLPCKAKIRILFLQYCYKKVGVYGNNCMGGFQAPQKGGWYI